MQGEVAFTVVWPIVRLRRPNIAFSIFAGRTQQAPSKHFLPTPIRSAESHTDHHRGAWAPLCHALNVIVIFTSYSDCQNRRLISLQLRCRCTAVSCVFHIDQHCDLPTSIGLRQRLPYECVSPQNPVSHLIYRQLVILKLTTLKILPSHLAIIRHGRSHLKSEDRHSAICRPTPLMSHLSAHHIASINKA